MLLHLGKQLTQEVLAQTMVSLQSIGNQSSITLADTTYLLAHKFADGKGFPPSYLDFATRWGWGRLCGLLLAYLPLGQYPDSWLVQSRRIREKMDDFYADMDDDDLFLLEPDGYAGLEHTLVPFASSENGGYLAWDAASRDADNELPIYVIAANLGGIRYGGKNFDQFVENCTGADVTGTLGPSYEPLPATFEPLPIYQE